MRPNRAHRIALTAIIVLFSLILSACGPMGSSSSGGTQEPAAAPLQITSTTLPTGQVSTSYSQILTSAGGKTPVQWTVTAGTVPAGLTMSTSGTISGSPTVVGVFPFTVQAADSSGQQVTRPFSLTVSAANLQVTTTSLPGGILNTPYNFQILTGGATGAVTFTISSGSLPAGLSLSSSGLISGTPTALGTSTVTVVATDTSPQTVSRQFQIAIAPPALSITSTSLPNGPVSTGYSASLTASGGVAPYSWSISAGAPPAGLSLSSAGAIIGTPSAPGTFVFTVRVSDAANQAQAHQFSITVTPTALSITTTSLASGTAGTAYTDQVLTSGGFGAVSLAVTSGALPAGLTMAANGTISGTPTSVGDFTFTVTATDAAAQSVSRSLSIHIAATTLVIGSSSLPNGTVSSAYSTSLVATGGVAPYNWTVTGGALPNGLTLSSAGNITGTPTVPNTFVFTATVNDNSGQQQSHQFSITINPQPLMITTSSLASGVSGTPYSAQVLTSGGFGTITIALASGALPTGLSIATNGTISGTPTSVGDFNFVVSASDTASQVVTRSLSIHIAASSLVINTMGLPSGSVGVAYNTSLSASGGLTPYTWSLASGSPPAGLSLSPAGDITGTPTANGTVSFTVQVSDSSAQTQTKLLSLTINASAIDVAPLALSDATQNVSYNGTVSGSGGTGPYSFTVLSGALPNGLTLSSGGTLSGTPTTLGSFSFVIQATDSFAQAGSRAYSITVNPSPLQITTASVPGGTVGQSYTTTLASTGGTLPVTWSISAGTLPAGLTLSSAGTLSGTPTASGPSTFTVQVADSAAQTATHQFSVTINPAPLVLSTSSLPSGQVSTAYSTTLVSAGGTLPYSYSVVAGSLPSGVTLSSGGVLSGTPTAAGNFNVTIRVTDAAAQTAQRAFTLIIQPPPLQITTASLPSGTVTQAYSASMTFSGGTAPVTWTISAGTLPAGVTMNSAGVFAGTPTTAGGSTFTVKATDSGSQIATQQYSVTINPAPLVLNSTSLPAGQSSTAYSFAMSASGGTAPYTYSIASGALPTGFTMSSAGVISGTTSSFGTFNVTVNLVDAGSQNVQRQFTLNIQPPALQITTSSVPDTVKGQTYSQTLAANGGVPPLTWTVASGALPSGLSLSTSGAIAGTTTAAGTFAFTAQVSDTATQNTTRQFSIVVLPPSLSLDTTTLPVASSGQGYTSALAASGGTPPYTWALVSGTLPSGLTLSSTGVIDGTTTTTGQFAITIRVSDQSSQTAQRQFTLTVQPPPLTIVTTALPDANNGSSYSFTAAGSGGVPPYTWSITSGALPPGMTFSAAGTFSGTPTQSGQYGLRLALKDSTGANTSRNLTLNVVPVFRITNRLIYGGITGAVYSDGITVADATGGSSFSIVSGTMAPGLGLNSSTGAITGSPTLEGTYTITVKAIDSGGHSDTKTFAFIISPSDSNYGNIGNAYTTEGGAADFAATQLTGCQTLPGPASYRLSRNVSATNASSVCFKLAGGVKLDLGGFTVTGRIYMNTNANNTVIFNGRVNCNWADNGSDAGCVNINSDNSVTSVSRIHHLTLSNTAEFSRAMHIEWPSPDPAPAVSLRIYNITSTVLTQLNVSRSFAISMVAPNHRAEVFNNDLTCNFDAAGCQAMMCYHVADCKVHHNRVNMIQNTTQQDGRAILLDNSDTGEVWNNTITANNNRAVRVRDTYHVRIHDNLITSAAVLGDGAIHLADPDPTRPDNDLDALVDKNTFQDLTGNAIFLRNGFNATVRNNTIQCGGAGCFNHGFFVLAGKPNNAAAGTVSKITVLENPNVILTLPAPHIFSDVQATVTACNSGTVTGPGSITILPAPCP